MQPRIRTDGMPADLRSGDMHYIEFVGVEGPEDDPVIVFRYAGTIPPPVPDIQVAIDPGQPVGVATIDTGAEQKKIFLGGGTIKFPNPEPVEACSGLTYEYPAEVVQQRAAEHAKLVAENGRLRSGACVTGIGDGIRLIGDDLHRLQWTHTLDGIDYYTYAGSVHDPDDEHTEFVNKILEPAHDAYDNDVACESIAIDFVEDLVWMRNYALHVLTDIEKATESTSLVLHEYVHRALERICERGKIDDELRTNLIKLAKEQYPR